jgi:hypothetical protein
MKTEYLHKDGTPVETGNCVVPDHWVTVFEVTVRSLGPLTGEEIKQVVQKKYEVVHQPRVNRSVCVIQ